MKKTLVILMLPVFLLSTIGITVTSIYCKGKLSQSGYETKACCKDMKKGGCCEKKAFQIKVKDNFLKTELSNKFSKSIEIHVCTDNAFFALKAAAEDLFLNKFMPNASPFRQEPCYILFHSLIV